MEKIRRAVRRSVKVLVAAGVVVCALSPSLVSAAPMPIPLTGSTGFGSSGSWPGAGNKDDDLVVDVAQNLSLIDAPPGTTLAYAPAFESDWNCAVVDADSTNRRSFVAQACTKPRAYYKFTVTSPQGQSDSIVVTYSIDWRRSSGSVTCQAHTNVQCGGGMFDFNVYDDIISPSLILGSALTVGPPGYRFASLRGSVFTIANYQRDVSTTVAYGAGTDFVYGATSAYLPVVDCSFSSDISSPIQIDFGPNAVEPQVDMPACWVSEGTELEPTGPS